MATGRERVAELTNVSFKHAEATCNGEASPYWLRERAVGDAIASDLDSLDAARKAAGPLRERLAADDAARASKLVNMPRVSLTTDEARAIIDALQGKTP